MGNERTGNYEPRWTSLPSKAKKRLEVEMAQVTTYAQRELIRAGIVRGPERADWQLADGMLALHSGSLDRDDLHRTTIVHYAAMAVRATFEAVIAGRIDGVRKFKGVEYTVQRRSRYPKYSALGHFCFLLHQSSEGALTLFEIAEIIGEVAERSSYDCDDAWARAREMARRGVQQRIRRFSEANPQA